MLRRPYPMAMAGTLASCRLDPSTGVFECTWKDDPAAKQPSRIYIPATWYPAGCDVTIKPLGQGHRFEPINGNKRNGYLTIPPLARPAERHLVIRAEK